MRRGGEGIEKGKKGRNKRLGGRRGEKREEEEGGNTEGGEGTGRKREKKRELRKVCYWEGLGGLPDTHFDPANQIGN